ncbi:hypothetical protein [Nonomuraea sp. NPDC049141]|uniref:hypothetical protein n=1 Tax=unclassified Nonomuraea TaxID=2593643 RepID=UPI0033D477E4
MGDEETIPLPCRTWHLQSFDLPVLAWIPHDPKSAAVLSDGKRARKSFHRSALIHGTVHLGYAMRHHAKKAVAR